MILERVDDHHLLVLNDDGSVLHEYWGDTNRVDRAVAQVRADPQLSSLIRNDLSRVGGGYLGQEKPLVMPPSVEGAEALTANAGDGPLLMPVINFGAEERRGTAGKPPGGKGHSPKGGRAGHSGQTRGIGTLGEEPLLMPTWD
jgi:hypothetical protein